MISSIAFPDMLSSSRMNTVQDTSATKSNLRLLLLSNKNSLFGDPYFGTELKLHKEVKPLILAFISGVESGKIKKQLLTE